MQHCLLHPHQEGIAKPPCGQLQVAKVFLPAASEYLLTPTQPTRPHLLHRLSAGLAMHLRTCVIWREMLHAHVLMRYQRHQGDGFILTVGVNEKGLGHCYALNKGKGGHQPDMVEKPGKRSVKAGGASCAQRQKTVTAQGFKFWLRSVNGAGAQKANLACRKHTALGSLPISALLTRQDNGGSS